MIASSEQTKTMRDQGVDIIVCAEHSLEQCPYCNFDFREKNKTLRKLAFLRQNVKKSGTRLGKGLHKVGTNVHGPDYSGHEMHGKIAGMIKNDDEADMNCGMDCYIIQYENADVDLDLVPVKDVHDDWSVGK